jgi:hypothetical protein
VSKKLKPRVVSQMDYIGLRTREEIVNTKDVMAIDDQTIAQMRT